MPRKSTLFPAARHAFYQDWPACLKRYRWVVEEAFRSSDPERMFNLNRSQFSFRSGREITCKVCGDGRRDNRKEMQEHLELHARQLGLIKSEMSAQQLAGLEAHAPGADHIDDVARAEAGVEESPELYADVASTIDDAFEARADEPLPVNWDKELSSVLASAIVGHVKAIELTEPALCADCQQS